MSKTTLCDTIRERLAIEAKLDNLTREYEAAKAVLEKETAEYRRLERELQSGLDPEKMALGRSILDVRGNIRAITDGCEGLDNCIAECAIRDILGGCRYLREMYFGNKRYAMYYQRNDGRYGWGPTYGSIVDRVGLREKYWDRDLTPEEQEAAVYYIRNYNELAERTA